MKKLIWIAMAITLLLPPASLFAGELDVFINNLNVEAQADLGAFKARLSAHFGVTVPEVDVLIKSVDRPADAYMCLRVGQVAKQPTEVVLKEYKANKGKGWGVIAKNLGIKPGSKEFHELKKGWDSEKEHGKGKGKGRGHNK